MKKPVVLLCCVYLFLCLISICCTKEKKESVAGQSSEAQSKSEEQKAITLDKQMSLTLDVRRMEEGSINADGDRRTIERGLEVALTFENAGTEPVENSLIAAMKPDVSQITLVGEDGKEIVPVAMKLEGAALGYRTVNTPGGIAIAGCNDNPPVAVANKDGSHAGLICIFCTKPKEKDTVIVMFPKPKGTGEVTIKLKCDLCPKEGLNVKRDIAKV